MKPLPALFVLLLGSIAAAKMAAQAPPQSDTNNLKLLRQTIADQKSNPDKIIRTYTNTQPEQTQIVSPVQLPPSELPVFKPEPPSTAPVSPKSAAAAALERQFLDGKLSSRQYKKALADLEHANKPAAAGSPKTSVMAPATSDSAPHAPGAQPTARQQKVSDVENKIDEMIRQKEARERAAQTNSIPAPASGMSKRQRLDFLLKQVVEGRLSDEEYKKQREKILAEPD